jgi:hypothetical protein
MKPSDYKKWGCETLDQIRRELYLPNQELYAEEGGTKQKVAFNWPAGVMLSALAAGAKVEPKYKPWLREYADACEAYWNREGPVAGYSVLPNQKPSDRFYDDNAWMCLALIETSEVLGDQKYLKRAEATFKYVWSGWDTELGGGIYWREREKKSKNCCSNAPSAVAAFRLAQETRNYELLRKAENIAAFTWSNFYDPEASLLSDNKSLSGKLDKTKWSYNTALMMRYHMEQANASSHMEAHRCFQVAKMLATAAIGHWMKGDTIADDAAFSHLLFEALVQYNRSEKDAGLSAKLDAALTTLWEKNRDSNGHFGKRWETVATEPYKQFRLIDQASAARAFFVMAAN